MTNLCQLCNTLHKTCGGLVSHVVQKHNIKSNEYYDRFIKKDSEGFCKSCGNPTKFHNMSIGYRTTCSQNCSRKLMSTPDVRLKAQKTTLDKYGVIHASMCDDVKNKISVTQTNRLIDPKEREKISICTKKAMQRDDVKEKLKIHHTREVSHETRQKQSISAKNRFVTDPSLKDRIYTDARNEKISNAKKKYWSEHPEEKDRVANLWKLEKEKDEVKWKQRLLHASKKGFKKIYSPTGETSLEIKLYKFLSQNNIKYQKQYELEGKLFDAYLNDYNILLEFDGDFWHKSSLDECVYDFQKESYCNDQVKTQIAQLHRIPLYRIREHDDPSIISNIISKYK